GEGGPMRASWKTSEATLDAGVVKVRVCGCPSGRPVLDRTVFADSFLPGTRSTYVAPPGSRPASEKSARVGQLGWKTTVRGSRSTKAPVAGTCDEERIWIVFV